MFSWCRFCTNLNWVITRLRHLCSWWNLARVHFWDPRQGAFSLRLAAQTIPVWQFQSDNSRGYPRPPSQTCVLFFCVNDWTISIRLADQTLQKSWGPGILGLLCSQGVESTAWASSPRSGRWCRCFFLLFSLFVSFRCTRFHPWHVNLACSIGRAECSLRAVRPGLEGAGGPLEGQRQPCVGVMMGSHGNGEIILG